MNFFHKKLWIAWSKFRFLMLPGEKRARLEVTTDGRQITFILVSLYEAGYGVQVYGGDWFFRELMLLRKTAPIPFLYAGKERECGISITDKSGFNHGEHGEHRGGKRFFLDYDFFSGLTTEDTESTEHTTEQLGRCLAEKSKVGPKGTQVVRVTARESRLLGGTEKDCRKAAPKEEQGGILVNQIAARQPEGRDERERTSQISRIYTDGQLGDAQETCAGDAFSNPSTSGLARDSENTPPTRTANGPAEEALRADHMGLDSDGGNQPVDSMEFLEGQSQAGLQMDNQKGPTIRTANDPSASGENSSSVLIRDICGQKSGNIDFPPEALRAPYFMHPSVYHRGLHRRRSSNIALDSRLSTLDSAAKQRRRFRLGFFGTHDREFYTKNYNFLGMNRFEILEVFLQKLGDRMTHLRGFPRDWDSCEIAVSIDDRGGDRRGKSFLSRDHYFAASRECDFVLSPPGWCMPVSHNLIEAMFCGAIPITNGGAFMAEPLTDGVNCLEFEDAVTLVSVIERALAMDDCEVARMRKAVRDYYDRFLEPKAFGEVAMQSNSSRILVNAEEKSVPLVFPGMVFPWHVTAEARGR